MDYDILMASSIELLTLNVNSRIKRGWKPQGGVAMIHFSSYDRHYSQAMIKEEAK